MGLFYENGGNYGLASSFVRIYLKKRIFLAVLLGLNALSGYKNII
jgi:hypothetical protein